MTAFFVDWDLWQEMTFVLGCCIVLVFAMGLVKLWWSNRAIRRLEIIDEEKRARISLMSRCGIENMRAPGIPFGVRAILSGVEVEGIWISRPNSPGPCQLTPVATQINCNHTGSRSSSSCNDDFITPEQTPPGSTISQTEAFDKGKGHSVSDTIFNIEQLNALPRVRKPSAGSVAMPSGHPRVLRSEKRRLISESSSS
ncbi:hypothetical protein FOC4_g10014915 [Fusarium odoratissimum]|uniref:Uncharacterized protein n=1 Tax=Fusarium oxysporum f. sp. cubense (strain race 4) TaxID=2502994 RepID=N1R7D4_FUSC4|nr:hypothetical protein FOC4_g10014915 [Fusarium odoratissimum]